MIYEPQNLKNKKAAYDKKDKWNVGITFVLWAAILFGYVKLMLYINKTKTVSWVVIVGGLAVISILYFGIAAFLLMRRGKQFREMNNAIVQEYNEDKNAELFLDKLLAIDAKPKDMAEEMTWYLNIATAYKALGRRKDCIELYKQLEEVSSEKNKDYFRKSIKALRCPK